MVIPHWAATTFGVVFFVVLGLASWSFRYLAGRVSSDIEKLGNKMESVDKKVDAVGKDVGQVKERLARVETRVNGQYGQVYTPPFGVPTDQQS